MARAFRHNEARGAGILEVVLALGVAVLLTPFIYRFAFKELAEVKYITASKQLKIIHQSLMNYAMVKSYGTDTLIEISSGLRSVLDDYGLTSEVSDQIFSNSKLKYTKDSTGYVKAYVIVEFDKAGMDDMGFRQTLLYAGDFAGYKDGSSYYSITGAWVETTASAVPVSTASQVAVVRVDTLQMENHPSSSVYLYRNKSGSDNTPNTMEQHLDMNGHDIKDFRIMSALSLPSVQSVKFGTGAFTGRVDVKAANGGTGSLIVNGILAMNGGGLITPKMDVSIMLRLKEIATTAAELTAAPGSLKPILFMTGVSSLKHLKVRDLVFGASPAYVTGISNLNIYGYDSSAGPPPSAATAEAHKLRLVFRSTAAARLIASIIDVRNGYLSGSNGKFDNNNGVMKFSGAGDALIYNMGRTYKSQPEGSGLSIKSSVSRFDSSIDSLHTDILALPQ